MSHEPPAELLDGAVLGSLRFPLGQVLAEPVRNVDPDKRWYPPKSERGSYLLEIFDDVIGQPEGDQGHGFVWLHVALDAISHFHSVSFLPVPQALRR